MADHDAPVGINRLDRITIASNKSMFSRSVGFGPGVLTQDEIDALRPEVYKHLAENSKDTLFLKVHDAYTWVNDSAPLFPPSAGRKAVYILRNPLDVAVSFAHHLGHSNPSKAIDKMANPKAALSKPKKYHRSQLMQKMGSWSQHVQSWVNAPDMDVLTIRYEDMKLRPLDTFKMIAEFTDVTSDEPAIDRAILYSSFERLKKEEENYGFREKPAKSKRFFRKGLIGSWQKELTVKQVEDLIGEHGDVMKQFGYLNGRNQPVF